MVGKSYGGDKEPGSRSSGVLEMIKPAIDAFIRQLKIN